MYTVCVVQALSKEVKFKYKFQLEPNGAYGSLKNGKWTGMIAELRSQQADMAAIDMSITSIRQQAVDFTMPFMNTGNLKGQCREIFAQLKKSAKSF